MIKVLFRGINIGLIYYLVFFQKKETESTWAWILLLWNFPITGFFLFLFTGQSVPKKEALNKEEHIGYLTEDNHLEILTTGEEKFQAVFKDIQNAKKEILIQYYIFKDDFLFHTLKKLLCKKAAEGVSVKVLYDGLGSRKIKKKCWREMKQKGVQVRCFRHSFWQPLLLALTGFNYRNHRKIIVIDGYIGYLGGYNIGKEYLGLDSRFGCWRDTHFRIVGSAVHSLRNVFLKDWQEEKQGEPIEGGHGGCAIQMVSSGPDTKAPHIRNVYLRCISKAKKRIWIQTPYFVPDQVVFNALKLALLSGKEVKIMIPCKPDHMFVYHATLYYASQLLEMGAGIYIYREGFLHAKGMLMDDEIYCYGTANLDNRSFFLNYEINAIVYGKEEVRKMCAIYEEDLKKCKELTWQEYQMENPVNHVKEQISRLLSPLL